MERRNDREKESEKQKMKQQRRLKFEVGRVAVKTYY